MKKILSILLILMFISTNVKAEEFKVNKPEMLFSQAAIVMDTETGSILYSKNKDKKMNPASITKVATAIYALEHGNLEDIVTISQNAANTEGSSVYLLPGEKMSLRQLLQGMMVNSGNDAAVAIAEHLDGSVGNFSKNINQFLNENIGVDNTHFTNPHGLYDQHHYTTAFDMGKITNYAMKNEEFKKLFSIEELPWSGKGWETTLINHHRMLIGEILYPEVTGGKNGFVDEAKHTLITTAKNNHLSITIVVMKAQSKKAIYRDTKSLLDYGLKGFTRSMMSKDTQFTFGDNIYKLTDNLVYTHPKDGDVTEKLTPEGNLTLLNSANEEIYSVDLESQRTNKNREPSTVSATTGHVIPGNLNKVIILYPIFLYLILLVIAGISMFRQREQNI
ncbi:D-alanyl-D-alanine carboxypeptidase [Bacillus pakistanensis]|uniref:D-alanyl-D-alanine carboxypeptidase n=1 Tax=Rossellomorea pakistanensis TaxID=992288 RepID=A0ABS2N8C5_9BACI|nr:D-alanyl-D-alanine carboxypeptidase family protein [Bacillus pakistanensis]MBM7584117.1 D-alanyl-D-alanine carboxypeptidase [Bacillus pakistanensis]